MVVTNKNEIDLTPACRSKYRICLKDVMSGIDEAQFFDDEIILFSNDLANLEFQGDCCWIDMDFKGNCLDHASAYGNCRICYQSSRGLHTYWKFSHHVSGKPIMIN
jgi:hypothetical protein